MAETMKAVRQHAFGGPEVLVYEDAPKPVAGSGELLVRVHAAGLNPPDWNLRDGYRSLPPEWQPQGDFPLIIGTDISGVVETVGPDVSDFKVGDEVYAMVRFPGNLPGASEAYAQYVTVPSDEAALKPASIDHVHAAGAPMSALTAWQFLVALGHAEPNPFQPVAHAPVPLEGKTVLVNGAAGGVGHFAVQLAKLYGAKVYGVASGQHEELLRELGVDWFIDYTKTPAESVARDVDLVMDCVGGPAAARFIPIIREGGALFLAYPLGFDANDAAKAAGVTVSATQVRSNGAQLAEIATLFENGQIRTVVDSTYALSEASSAHARAEKGHIQGKIVFKVD